LAAGLGFRAIRIDIKIRSDADQEPLRRFFSGELQSERGWRGKCLLMEAKLCELSNFCLGKNYFDIQTRFKFIFRFLARLHRGGRSLKAAPSAEIRLEKLRRAQNFPLVSSLSAFFPSFLYERFFNGKIMLLAAESIHESGKKFLTLVSSLRLLSGLCQLFQLARRAARRKRMKIHVSLCLHPRFRLQQQF
jgi:hypothetical protein